MNKPHRVTVSSLALLSSCSSISTLLALPPLGLTSVTPEPAVDLLTYDRIQLSILGDNAYISDRNHVWSVDAQGAVNSVAVTHPVFGSRSVVTRVATDASNGLFVGATFHEPLTETFDPIGTALYHLEDPVTPIRTWGVDPITHRRPHIVGLDRNLRGVGNLFEHNLFESRIRPIEFLQDGSMTSLELPEDPVNGGLVHADVRDVSIGGTAVGSANEPGTLGTKGAIWDSAGNFSLDQAFIGISVRDRDDMLGLNIGFDVIAEIRYGDRPLTTLGQTSDPFIAVIDGGAIVSQTDFAVVNPTDFTSVPFRPMVYYPGIVPGDPNAPRPLEEIFPELLSVDFDTVTDLYAVDGHIFMTLTGPDGLYLFGARDPSVIPEPSTWTLLVMSLVVACAMGLRGRGP